jgi:2-keto-4-pentenoate hydratase/2-oxohepta-3-ene-1,7-dioic acid hydratase in catechol pathway
MRLATINFMGHEVPAIVTPHYAIPTGFVNRVEKFVDEREVEPNLISLIESGLFQKLKTWHDDGGAEGWDRNAIPLDAVSYAPLYRRPRKIWGIGLNYAEHAGDLSESAPAVEPASFMRPDTTIIGPGDEIKLPPQSGRVTGEAELAVIIGREAENVSVRDAPSVVAGLTTVLDMTAEDILRRNPRYLTRSKSFDTFFSFGPELVTLDEIEDVEALEVSTVVNGEVRRRNTVSNMTFSPWELVAVHSEVMTLVPGDIISTGTPGAAVIRDGDVLECRISGMKTLMNPVVEA